MYIYIQIWTHARAPTYTHIQLVHFKFYFTLFLSLLIALVKAQLHKPDVRPFDVQLWPMTWLGRPLWDNGASLRTAQRSTGWTTVTIHVTHSCPVTTWRYKRARMARRASEISEKNIKLNVKTQLLLFFSPRSRLEVWLQFPP